MTLSLPAPVGYFTDLPWITVVRESHGGKCRFWYKAEPHAANCQLWAGQECTQNHTHRSSTLSFKCRRHKLSKKITGFYLNLSSITAVMKVIDSPYCHLKVAGTCSMMDAVKAWLYTSDPQAILIINDITIPLPVDTEYYTNCLYFLHNHLMVQWNTCCLHKCDGKILLCSNNKTHSAEHEQDHDENDQLVQPVKGRFKKRLSAVHLHLWLCASLRGYKLPLGRSSSVRFHSITRAEVCYGWESSAFNGREGSQCGSKKKRKGGGGLLPDFSPDVLIYLCTFNRHSLFWMDKWIQSTHHFIFKSNIFQ